MVDCRARAADRVGESREPAAVARDCPPAGILGAARHWRIADPRPAAGAGRERRPCRIGIGGGARGDVYRQPIDRVADQHGGRSDLSRSVDRLADVRLYGARRRHGGGHCRPRAGAARRPRHGLPSRRARHHGTARGPRRSARAGVAASRGHAGAALRRPVVPAQLPQPGHAGPRRAAGRRGDCERLFSAVGVSGREARAGLRGPGRPAARPAGCDRARRGPRDSDGRQLQRSRRQGRWRDQGQFESERRQRGLLQCAGHAVGRRPRFRRARHARRAAGGDRERDTRAEIPRRHRRAGPPHRHRQRRRTSRTRSTKSSVWSGTRSTTTSANRSRRSCTRRHRSCRPR